MGVVKGYYNEELFGKAIGQENVSCPIECNMDEDNIEYYIGDNAYPNIISKEELKLKCKENKVSYNILMKTNTINYIERTKARHFNGFKFNKNNSLTLWNYSDQELDTIYNNVKIILDSHILLCKMKSGIFSIVIGNIVSKLPPHVTLRDAKEYFLAMALTADDIDEIIESI